MLEMDTLQYVKRGTDRVSLASVAVISYLSLYSGKVMLAALLRSDRQIPVRPAQMTYAGSPDRLE